MRSQQIVYIYETDKITTAEIRSWEILYMVIKLISFINTKIIQHTWKNYECVLHINKVNLEKLCRKNIVKIECLLRIENSLKTHNRTW